MIIHDKSGAEESKHKPCDKQNEQKNHPAPPLHSIFFRDASTFFTWKALPLTKDLAYFLTCGSDFARLEPELERETQE